MPAVAPFEIIAGPVEVWRAAVGSTFTDVSQTPGAPWVKVGTSGNKNIREEGVTVRHMQEVELDAFRMVGTTGPRGAVRTSEQFEIEFELADLKATEYANMLNGPDHTITTVAAGTLIGGQKQMNIQRGFQVNRVALIIRGTNLSPEPVDATSSFNIQYQVPIAAQVGEPEVVYNKEGPAALRFRYVCIEHDTLGFGKFIIQTAAPS